MKARSTSRVIRGFFTLGLLLTGCPQTSEVEERIASFEPPEAHRRFIQIRTLLGQEVQSTARSTQLFGLVDPICRRPAERDQFIESLRWSVSFSTEEAQLPTLLGMEVVEHVATACARTSSEVGLELVRAAGEVIETDRGRLDVLEARLLAASGALDQAARAAQRARKAGSVHAIALLANIQAREARAAGKGFRAGMLDQALETVSVEPDAKWQAIDLTAVLATRARLAHEKAFWSDGPARKAALATAHAAFERLARAPFVEAIRRSSQDALCFDAVRAGAESPWCESAARAHGILGAARVAALAVDAVPKLDALRAARLDWARNQLEALNEEARLLVVLRGDELELLEWARPAVELLRRLKGRVTLVDRTADERGEVLVTEILSQAQLQPARRLRVGRDPLAMPCIAALAAGRRAPEGCALSEQDRTHLMRPGAPQLAIFIGRDLDSDIDDVELYDIPSVLLSFRQAKDEEALEAWLKSLCDVWWLFDEPA